MRVRIPITPWLGGLLISLGLLLGSSVARAGESGPKAGPRAPASRDEAPDAAPATLKAQLPTFQSRPDDLRLALSLADAWIREGRPAAGRRALRRLVTPQATPPVATLVAAFAEGGPKGLRKMRAALDQLPAETDTALLAGAWALLRGEANRQHQIGVEREAAERVVALRGNAGDHGALGRVLQQTSGHEREARAAYERAFELDPSDLRLRNELALLRAMQSDVTEALDLATKSVEKFPRHSSAHLYLGLIRSMSGDTDGGKAAYARALACTNDDPDALAAIAAAYTEIEDYGSARLALKRALEANPKHCRSLTAMAALALQEGLPEEALKRLRAAGSAALHDARLQFLRGVAYERLERWDGAIAAYRAACRISRETLSYALALARALEQKGSLGTASSTLRKLTRRFPENARIHMQYGMVEMKRRKYAQALEAFQRVAVLVKDDPRPWFFIAVIHGDRKGDIPRAIEALEHYEQMGGEEPTALAWLERLRASRKSAKK